MAPSGRSYFSYSITKPYPSRWFDFFALASSAILLVVFTIVNLVTDGYTLVNQSSFNPNATVKDGPFFMSWPSFFTEKVLPSCQDIDFPVNGQFWTNQSGLLYTLTGVWSEDTGAAPLPSLTYANNPLGACSIDRIQMDFENFNRPMNEVERLPWGIDVRAFVTCELSGPLGATHINASVDYNFVTTFTMPGVSTFISQNETERPSLYWAESLLSAYYTNTSFSMSNADTYWKDHGNQTFTSGVLYYQRNPSVTNISSLDFFQVGWEFFAQDITAVNAGNFMYSKPNTTQNFVDSESLPNIWFPADRLAKSMYSAVLTDLGQVGTPTISNVLTDATTLQEYSLDLAYINSTVPPNLESPYPAQLVQTGPATTDYLSTLPPGSTPDLGITHSVISARYLCQVPRRKPKASLILSILNADLVFLQATWWVVLLVIAKFWLSKKDENNYCEGCRRKTIPLHKLSAGSDEHLGDVV